MAAAELANMKRGENKSNGKNGMGTGAHLPTEANENKASVADAAQKLDVSERSVKSAKKVKDKAPELVEAVKGDKLAELPVSRCGRPHLSAPVGPLRNAAARCGPICTASVGPATLPPSSPHREEVMRMSDMDRAFHAARGTTPGPALPITAPQRTELDRLRAEHFAREVLESCGVPATAARVAKVAEGTTSKVTMRERAREIGARRTARVLRDLLEG